ncbi:DUF294 nucleotidyltransferase-like domain-containing protein [Parasalinivibrio latis]|uniref:DUF294 nucleotidyltransferase-like domain-containing protein n=1 Tax=Parasalinivibrio latis TaxID=2952610 RepID=UPI0030E48D74
MEAEQLEILGFISQYEPFNELPEEAREEIAQKIEVSYFRAGTEILPFGGRIDDLHLIRSGAVEIYRRKGELYDRMEVGDIFGQMGLLMNNKVRLSAKALEDTLIYFIPGELFYSLCDRFESFADFVEVEDRSRLRQAVSSREDANDLTTSKVKTLIARDPVTISKTESIRQAAQLMARESVSSLLITDPDKILPESADDDPTERVMGIITDRDFRTRVLAEGVDPEQPVAEIVTPGLVCLDHNAYVFEAMLTMLRYNLHHLPIMRHQQAIGVVSLSDIVRYESQSSLLLVRSIFRQNTVDELKAVSEQVKSSFMRMVNEDANSHMIGSAMSVIGRSFKQRLVELAEQEFGEPPVPYCFLALGSMARDEQLIVTDQDNAIILDDEYDETQHGDYFRKLSYFVSDGLAACGYAYCKGKIMATNPRWRMTRSQWEACFADWIDKPNPESLLNSSIFFDLDGVYGRTDWAENLKSFIARRARRNNRFLACMARNALNRTPPLGFFKEFVMEKDGRHNNSINLKRRGTAPLADLIRVHALAIGSRAQNSFERLDDIIEAGILPKGRGPDLRDALEFISMVRIRHQALDIEAGNEPDNNIEPENMSDFERRNLKDAFQILSNAQKFLKFRYQPNRAN